MLRTILLAAALSAAGAGAMAQPRPDGPPPERGRHGPPPGGGLFISPAGEPFRGPDGRAAWFAGADANHDGALSLEEFRADAMRFFRRLDADANGAIDNFENQAYEQKIAPEITRMSFDREPGGGGMGGPGGGGMPGRKGGDRMNLPREGAARYSLLNEPQPVRGADANLDGRITADEWSKAAARRFALLDKAGLGKLTLAALPPTPGGEGPPGKRPRRR